MAPYLLILLLPLAWLQPLQRHAFGRLGFVLAALALALFVGLRKEVGGDWYAYVSMYDRAVKLSLRAAMEVSDPGYMLLCVVAASLNTGVWLVNLMCAALFVGGLAVFCRRLPFPALALLISIPVLVVISAMGFTRQAAALGLLLGAYCLFEKGKQHPLLLLLVVPAITLHWSAGIFLPLAALLGWRRELTIPWAVASGAAAAAAVLILYAAVPEVGDYIDRSGTANGAAFRLLLSAGACALYFARGEFGLEAWQRTSMRYMIAITFACILLLPVFPTIADRIGLYLVPLQMVALTGFAASFPEASTARRAAIGSIVATYCVFYVGWMLNSPFFASAWAPYENYLLSGFP